MSRADFISVISIFVGLLSGLLSLVYLVSTTGTIKRFKRNLYNKSKAGTENSSDARLPAGATWLIKILLFGEAKRDYIEGDLDEAYSALLATNDSIIVRFSARFWLYSQIVRSFAPLFLKSLKARLRAARSK